MLYLVINKTSSVPTEKNITIQKKFTPLNSVKKGQFRSQNKTLPTAKFLHVNQKQKKNHNKMAVNRPQDTQVSKKKTKEAKIVSEKR